MLAAEVAAASEKSVLAASRIVGWKFILSKITYKIILSLLAQLSESVSTFSIALLVGLLYRFEVQCRILFGIEEVYDSF